MVTCYLGLGSNLGDSAGAVKEGVDRLVSEGDVVLVRLSSLYITRPWGHEDQPDFINAVAEIQTDLQPLELLEKARSVERDAGRVERFKWGPRELDIDLLLYGKEVLDLDALKLPHPLMAERAFVLVPLLEIAPDLVHPATGVRFSDSLRNLGSRGEGLCEKLTT